jgi:peptidoglycan/LPS O-acetylase OafA/YrhL
MIALRLPRIVGWAGVVFVLGSGVWAFAAPRSFYDNIATFEPYNRHFLHDIGVFTIGLGAMLLLALVTRWEALRVALAGLAVASVMHVVSHAVDSHLGGRDTDLPALTVVALLFVLGAAAAQPSGRTTGHGGEPDSRRAPVSETPDD